MNNITEKCNHTFTQWCLACMKLLNIYTAPVALLRGEFVNLFVWNFHFQQNCSMKIMLSAGQLPFSAGNMWKFRRGIKKNLVYARVTRHKLKLTSIRFEQNCSLSDLANFPFIFRNQLSVKLTVFVRFWTACTKNLKFTLNDEGNSIN